MRTATRLTSQLRARLPSGGFLPEDAWRSRHQGILILLWLHVPALAIYSLARGETLLHSLAEAAAVATFGAAARAVRRDRGLSTVAAAMGLLTASAVLVHLSDGLIEMHFHYFVMVGVITLYQEWAPFLVAIGYVVLQHGVAGTIWPEAVYNHPAAVNDPWLWAAIHGLFILGMSAAGVVTWRLNELLVRAASDRQELLAEAQEIASLGSWEWDVRSGAVTWSDEQFRLFGLAPGEIEPSQAAGRELIHPDDREMVADLVARALAGDGPLAVDFRVVLAGGETRWLNGRFEVTHAPDGEPLVLSGTSLDVTERRRSEDTLRRTLSLLSATLDSTADGILVVDAAGRMSSANRQFAEMWRIPDEVMAAGDDDRALAHVIEQLAEPESFLAKVRELYAHPDAESHDVVEFKDGRVFERYSKPQWVDGEAVGRVWSFRDVTDRRRLEAELAHQAFHDPLTGLANQLLFRDRVQHALARANRAGECLAVLFLDLDNFKNVNDSRGHPVGDELLVAVAERLQACLRTADTAARLGGDEFAVLMEGVGGATDATDVADRILAALRRPFVVGGKDVVLSVSIGVAFSAPEAVTSDVLLRNADVAMYKAKAAGKGRYDVFEPGMHAALLERLDVEADLRRAIESGEFVVHYQPIIRLDGRSVIGVEALVRWRHPERGLLAPASFIGVAEETGLIDAIGAHVLEEACRVVRGWQLRYPEHESMYVSVNLSPQQLADPDVAATVAEVLERTGLDPRTLILEVTEGAMVRNENAPQLADLRELGVLLALDDFGTGYSSLGYLQRFPVDLLKIDKSFVSNITTGVEEQALPQAIVKLAHTLHVRAVAEGVESSEQADLLGAWGCDLAQGYHFARPADRDAVEELLQDASRIVAAAAVGQ